jgi:hypothetical protein
MNFFQRFFRSALALNLIAGSSLIGVFSCTDDDGTEGTVIVPVTDENKTDAVKLSAAATAKLSTSSSGSSSLMLSTAQRLQIREIYLNGIRNQQMLADPGSSSLNFDICALYSSICKAAKEKGASTSDGLTCSFACPNDNAMTINCAADQATIQCKDTAYKLVSGTTSATTTCTKLSETAFELAMQSTMSSRISGGSIETPVDLRCSFKMNLSFDSENLANEANGFDTSKLCESFSCTLGGNALACEDVKNAIDNNACEASQSTE